MKIPAKVKIGGHIYKVEIQENDIDNSVCGRTMRTKGLIAISSELIESEKELTFFHEVIHILNGELKETECDWMAQAIYAFLKNNYLLK